MSSLYSRAGLVLVWALLTVVALWTRPLIPIDETRYAAVAWEMWLRGDWLVPYINGEPYSHKPPMLFWLINIGWAVLGVSDWVPRLVTALASLADLFLLGALARRLWPDDSRTAHLVPWMFYGCLIIALFATTLMFDLLMTVTMLLGLLGVVGAWREGSWKNWALYGLGIGLGILTKGPAILIYLLPVALLAPWWMGTRYPGGWGRWYRNTGLALLAGICLALCWAIPAVIHGGDQYREMILWGQTAGRMVQSFAHARPWWWYLPILPLLLLPWTLWLPLWRSLPALRSEFGAGERFCLAWFVPGFLVFSVVSGKQIHYLLPLLAALILLLARVLTRRPDAQAPSRFAVALVLLPFVLIGAAVAIAPHLAAQRNWPDWVGALSPIAGLALIAVVLPWAFLLRRPAANVWLAALPAVFLAVLHVTVLRVASPAFEMRELTAGIAALQDQGKVVALSSQYRDQYPFSQRMNRPLQLVPEGQELAWARANPEGALVIDHKGLTDEQRKAAQVVQRVGREDSVLWSAAALVAHPEYLGSERVERNNDLSAAD
ncbi:ArnT family glycosyltransferase [Pseudomonas akapageensis]|uniref:ArnT family glycosyltransferase n=1 Tax=Pseudomonas akapageensis TaxID=2609961 RepID=UPI00140E93EB|nr:glycosyltransferase family 39 protein [Pseudomonas akapageensis]